MSPQDPENLRTEYRACVDYHTSLVNTRFTIAGFYVAAFGVMINAWITNGGGGVRFLISAAAFVLTICAAVLELRSRALLRSMALRGEEIEEFWALPGGKQTFFSRMENGTREKKYDRPRCLFARDPDKLLSEEVSKHIRHSFALDLMYAGALLAWLFLGFASVFGLMPHDDPKQRIEVTTAAAGPASEAVQTLRIELDSKTTLDTSALPLRVQVGAETPTAAKKEAAGH